MESKSSSTIANTLNKEMIVDPKIISDRLTVTPLKLIINEI